MQDREISSEGLEFQPGTRLAESVVEIPIPRVRFPYPAWTGSLVLFLPPLSRLPLAVTWSCEIEVSHMGKSLSHIGKGWRNKVCLDLGKVR